MKHHGFFMKNLVPSGRCLEAREGARRVAWTWKSLVLESLAPGFAKQVGANYMPYLCV